MTYAELRERIVQGVIRHSADPPPTDRIRAVIDASFFQINSQVAEAFAARESKRELLRATKSLTFAAGTATLSDDVLKKFLEDATFTVPATSSHPYPKYSYRQWPDFLRGGDTRLGYWSTIGETIGANTPAPVIPLVGTASLTCICSPAIPALETDTYVAPDDFIPEVIDAGIQYILAQSMEMAAETA